MTGNACQWIKEDCGGFKTTQPWYSARRHLLALTVGFLAEVWVQIKHFQHNRHTLPEGQHKGYKDGKF